MSKITAEQNRAITATEQNVLLLAGAGTGKTHTSIERLKYLLTHRFVGSKEILCLTFTRNAAEEFKLRCADITAELPFIGTFHEFCYRLLCTDTAVLNKLGYSTAPHILEDFEEKEYKTKLKMQLGIKLSDKKLNNRSLCSVKEQFDFDTFHNGLKNAFRRDGVINFDQLCQGVCNLFITNDESIQRYKFQYKYIFVDEFQNTDDTQWNFVKSFDRANKFLVGDIMQSIYLFRNASPQIVADIVGNSEWSVMRLSKNFRSSQCILDVANQIQPSENYAEYKVHLVAEHEIAGRASIYKYDSRETLEHDILEDLEYSDSKDIAILTRTNWSVQKIQELLEEHNIPYTTNNSNELSDFEHFIKSVQNNRFLVSYLASKLKSKEYYDFLAQNYFGSLKEANTTQIINYLYENYQELLEHSIRKVNKFRAILFGEQSNEQKYQEICAMLKITPIDGSEQILNEDSSSSDIYDLVIETFKQNYHKESGIYVGTIHSAQGLEYEEVIITNVNAKEFKVDTDENKFLYYVGITRAKKYLTIYEQKGNDTQ